MGFSSSQAEKWASVLVSLQGRHLYIYQFIYTYVSYLFIFLYTDMYQLENWTSVLVSLQGRHTSIYLYLSIPLSNIMSFCILYLFQEGSSSKGDDSTSTSIYIYLFEEALGSSSKGMTV